MALQLKNGDTTYYQSAEYCRNYTSPPVSYGDSSHYLNRLPGKERLATSSRCVTECANMREGGGGVRGTGCLGSGVIIIVTIIIMSSSISLFSLCMLLANMRWLRHYNGFLHCREAIFLIFQGWSMGWGRGLTVIWNSAMQRLLSSLESGSQSSSLLSEQGKKEKIIHAPFSLCTAWSAQLLMACSNHTISVSCLHLIDNKMAFMMFFRNWRPACVTVM